jgi:hypothetical protein
VGVGRLMANHAVVGGIGVQGDPDLSVRRFVDEAEFTLCVEVVVRPAPVPAHGGPTWGLRCIVS